jgi:hypothetical protein
MGFTDRSVKLNLCETNAGGDGMGWSLLLLRRRLTLKDWDEPRLCLTKEV